jgi:translation initiation factor 1 (eIF-1/SUI1)
MMPIQVAIKMRQGRKVCTLITGFEPYLVVDAEEMAEDLRRVCAGSTSGMRLCFILSDLQSREGWWRDI